MYANNPILNQVLVMDVNVCMQMDCNLQFPLHTVHLALVGLNGELLFIVKSLKQGIWKLNLLFDWYVKHVEWQRKKQTCN